MALTVAQTCGNFGGDGGSLKSHVSQHSKHRFDYLTITFDSSYPTGGEAFSSKICPNVIAAWFDGDAAGTYYYRYDYTNDKILAFTTADGLEVAAATDLSLQVIHGLFLSQKNG